MQVETIPARLKWFFTRKWVYWPLIAILIVAAIIYFFVSRSGGAGKIQTDTAKREDVQKTVLATGEVVSSTNLNLSFQSTGVVSRVFVKEGDAVRAGQTLATLDQGSALASLKNAQGALAQAQANYDKVSAAATPQDIAVSQAAVDTAETTLTNAKQSLSQEVYLAYNNANSAVLTDTNGLFNDPQGSPKFYIANTIQNNQALMTKVENERLSVNASLALWRTNLTNLSDSTIDSVSTASLATLNLIHDFIADATNLVTTYSQATASSGTTALTTAQTNLASAKTSIDSAITTLTTDYQAVKSYQAALDQAKASLALKKAPARVEDVASAAAGVISAEAQVTSAEVVLEHTIIRAPADGTITQVDTKIGEQATTGAEVIVLQNISSLHTEADVSEADIAAVEIGQTIDYTFDALGPNKHFAGKVLTVNPASTVVSGVVNYRVTGSLDKIPGVKPGMTANMTIEVAQKSNVLVVPSAAVINRDGKQYVRIIDDPKTKTYHEVLVETGLEADGGLTEITSGLEAGQEIVTFVK